MKKLTKKELKVLKEVLALFEKRTRNETGVRYSSGGFATAEMFNYDDDVIDIELKWGVQSDCTNNVNTEQWKLKREELKTKKSIGEIVDAIYE
jgi:hypothetical protein